MLLGSKQSVNRLSAPTFLPPSPPPPPPFPSQISAQGGKITAAIPFSPPDISIYPAICPHGITFDKTHQTSNLKSGQEEVGEKSYNNVRNSGLQHCWFLPGYSIASLPPVFSTCQPREHRHLGPFTCYHNVRLCDLHIKKGGHN